jgi:hypothetical protein
MIGGSNVADDDNNGNDDVRKRSHLGKADMVAVSGEYHPPRLHFANHLLDFQNHHAH